MANTKSDALFVLIHSLTKTEKRFFKLHVGRHTIGEENNSLILFNFIVKMEVYDESQILKEFHGKSFLNKFSITKHRLYQLILDSLNQYHAKSSVENELMGNLQSAKILFSKGLYSQSKKIVNATLKKTERYYLPQLKWQALLLNRKITEQHFYTSLTDKDLGQLKRDELTVIESMSVNAKLWHIKASLFKQIHAIGTIRSEDQIELLKSTVAPLYELPEDLLGSDNEYLFQQILSAYYFAVYDMIQCYQHLMKIKEIYKQNAQLLKKNKGKYLSLLTNLTFVCIKNKHFTEADKYLEEIEKLSSSFDKSRDLKVKYFSSYYSLKLFIGIERGLEPGIEVVLNAIEMGLNEFEGHINPVRSAYLNYQIGVYHLAHNRFKEALTSINKVLNDKQNLVKEDIYSFAQILQLIIHFELKNYRYLPYVLSSTKRFLKEKNRQYKFEQIFLKIIGKIKSENISDFELEDILIDFEPEISQLKADKFEKMAFEYFDFGAWLNSKIKRKSYLEIKKASA